MRESKNILSQSIGEAQTRAIGDALRPYLRTAGIRTVEHRIGKPARFFENVRHRGTMKVRDFLATCAALERDPVEFLREALGDDETPEIRPPRIIGRAWECVEKAGPGIGTKRLAELEAAMQSRPRGTRRILGRELGKASKDELPLILGLYGSSYRVESDLDRAGLVLGRARELARELRTPAAEADILIRLAYVSLERDRLPEAIRQAEQATVVFARVGDQEGQGVGFLTMGILRYYGCEYRESLEDFEAALRYATRPQQRIASYQCSAHCLIKLNREEEARTMIAEALKISPMDSWMQGKLAWTEAHLTYGIERLECLKMARETLSRNRPADCALVTVELIEEALAIDHHEIAEAEALTLCALLEKTGSPRVERAIGHLIRHRTRLSPKYVAKIKHAVEQVQARRLSRLIKSDH